MTRLEEILQWLQARSVSVDLVWVSDEGGWTCEVYLITGGNVIRQHPSSAYEAARACRIAVGVTEAISR